MEISEITRREAGRFLLTKQGLLGRHRFIGKEGALSYVRQAGCIQFDPVDVCGRNAELTFQSRVRNFRKNTLEELLYRDRRLVDYADKELSILPAEDWPFFSPYRERSVSLGRQFEGIGELEEECLRYIGEHGPVSSATLPIRGEIFWHSSMHWSGNWQGKSQAARSVLEQLYTDGTLVIHHKEGSRKYYDLASRHLPGEILSAENPCRTEEEWLCWRVKRRIGAVGMLWNRRSDALLGIDLPPERRNAVFGRLLAEGRIREVRVEKMRAPLYILSGDEPLLRDVLTGNTDTRERCEFLAPLDPFLWDRKLIEAVFGFRYSWEIYTPAEKRKYGYYVLPVLFGEGFAGRIEMAADRKEHIFRIRNVWYEEGVRVTKKLKSAILRGVHRMAVLNGCGEIRGEEVLL